MNKEKDLEKLIEELQEKIENDEEADFSKKMIHEYRNPSNFGVLENPDAIGKIKGPCGDTMEIMLKIKNNRITSIRFLTDGCGTSIACGSMLTKIVKDKTLDEVELITSQDLNRALEGLPEDHVHCTILAVNTLRKALNNYTK
jgi:nitrogen fixation NifU-like protein